jgi:hypothetical protein
MKYHSASLLVGTMSTWLLVLNISAGMVLAAEDITKVFPESELIDAQISQGEISTAGYSAITAAAEALPDLNLRVIDFKSVSVMEAGASYYVLFSNRALYATYSGSPGTPRPIMVRVSKQGFRVLGLHKND